MPVQTSDLNDILDNAPLTGLALLVIAITTLVLILDGMDIQVISLVAPLLSRDFSVRPDSLGPVFAAALIGMAVGGFLLGVLGDRRGRRPMLIVSVFIFGAATLACATARGVAPLALWRFLTGVGLGGAVPNALALMAELTPARWRTMAVSTAVLGVPVGGMLGAALAGVVLPQWGWAAMFVIGGSLPLLTAAAIYCLLPESPRFLSLHPQSHDALVELLHRLTGTRPTTLARPAAERPVDKLPNPLTHLLSRPLVSDTIGLWLVFVTNMFVIFTFFSWSPVILSSLGLPLAQAVRGSLVFNVAGLVGGVLVASIVSRAGSRWPAVLMAIIGIAALASLARQLGDAAAMRSADVTVLMATIAVAGFAMIGIQTVAYRLSTHIYPTLFRASGVGWAAGLGRLGGILSSLTAGWLLKRYFAAGLFEILAGVVACTLVGLLMIRGHLSRSSLEEA